MKNFLARQIEEARGNKFSGLSVLNRIGDQNWHDALYSAGGEILNPTGDLGLSPNPMAVGFNYTARNMPGILTRMAKWAEDVPLTSLKGGAAIAPENRLAYIFMRGMYPHVSTQLPIFQGSNDVSQLIRPSSFALALSKNPESAASSVKDIAKETMFRRYLDQITKEQARGKFRSALLSEENAMLDKYGETASKSFQQFMNALQEQYGENTPLILKRFLGD